MYGIHLPFRMCQHLCTTKWITSNSAAVSGNQLKSASNENYKLFSCSVALCVWISVTGVRVCALQCNRCTVNVCVRCGEHLCAANRKFRSFFFWRGRARKPSGRSFRFADVTQQFSDLWSHLIISAIRLCHSMHKKGTAYQRRRTKHITNDKQPHMLRINAHERGRVRIQFNT